MEKKEILLKLRQETGMNRREFAEYFGIPYRTVQEWELGHREMPGYLLRLMYYHEKTKEKVWDNYELYWYSIPSFTYVEKSGAKVVEGSKKINTDDLIERAAIESFFNTLENTYTEHIESTKDGEYSVYANSRTTASITYTIVTTEYNVVKQAVTKADADALGSIKVDDYTTSKLSVSENQDIPGHGHSHGHGHGHGEGNAGGGVGELD